MYSCDCEDCKTSQLDGSNDYSVFENVLKAGKKAFKYLLKNGGYKAEDIHQKPYQDLINETNKVFQKVVQDNVMSKTLQNALASDAFLFGSLKTHAQLFEANTLLLNKNGVIKSQNELEYELDKLNVTYNNNYLEAERQFAISSSINADKWSKISNRYNLQYRTVNDDKVRDNHRVLHDIVLPVEDEFWKKYYPPNGWRCRCVAVEVRKSKYPESDSAKAIEAGEKATSQIGKDGKNRLDLFRFNPGIDQKLLPPNHPYHKVEGADKIKSKINKISNPPNRYLNYEFKEDEGISTGKLEIFTKGHQNKQEFKKNKNALSVLANNGYEYRMLPVINDGLKNPDAFNLIRKYFVDVKVTESTNGKSILQNALKEASKQGAKELVLHLTNKPDSYTEMYKALIGGLKIGRHQSIKSIVVIFPDNSFKEYDLSKIKKRIK